MILRFLFALATVGFAAASAFLLGRWYERDGACAAEAVAAAMSILSAEPYSIELPGPSGSDVSIYTDTSRPDAAWYIFDTPKRREVWNDERLTAPGGLS